MSHMISVRSNSRQLPSRRLEVSFCRLLHAAILGSFLLSLIALYLPVSSLQLYFAFVSNCTVCNYLEMTMRLRIGGWIITTLSVLAISCKCNIFILICRMNRDTLRPNHEATAYTISLWLLCLIFLSFWSPLKENNITLILNRGVTIFPLPVVVYAQHSINPLD
jgi:hypothetical protein